LIGLAAGKIFQPGIGVDLHSILETAAQPAVISKAPPTISEFLLNLIPTNPLNAMVSDNFLQIIIFSIFAGITINMVGEKAKPVKEFIYSAAQVSFKMIEIIIKLAPLGVFGFISWVIGTQGVDILAALAKLIVAVLAACAFQYVIFGLMILVFARISPMPFYRKILFTQSIAFATSSSKATLSTAMGQLQERMGVSKSNSNFLMPLGVCINMDGTAIYLAICALFFAQSYGIDLTTHNYLMLILTCTFGSIGAAGIPSGSIIFMGMVLTSVGLPIEGIGIILGVDRILDMVRTTINITGDSAITLIVDKTEGALDEKTYYSKTS
jgi:Na+/H+-dicarboxylate symporter